MTFAERVLRAAEQAKADGYTKIRVLVAEKDWPPEWPHVEFTVSVTGKSGMVGWSDLSGASFYSLEDDNGPQA